MSDNTKLGPNAISPSFCAHAWEQTHVTPMGIVKPCCIFDGSIKNGQNKPFRISDAPIEEIWNSPHYREIRQKMLNGEVIPECTKCMTEEKLYSTSDRIRLFKDSPELQMRIEESRLDGTIKNLPEIINLKIGNVCNLKCRMCQPLDSCQVDLEFSQISKISPEFRSFDNASAFDYYYSDEPISTAADWITTETAKNNLKTLLSHTRNLSLAGGEIAFTPEAIALLKECIELGYAKNITLLMSSNLTQISDSFLDMLSQFKETSVCISVDGTGDVIEYIRHPSKWKIIEKNIQRLFDAPAHVFPIFTPTVQVYNVFNIIEVYKLIESFRHPKWEIYTPCHLTILFSPEFLSIRILPKEIRMKAASQLEEFCKTSYYYHRFSVYADQLNLLIETLKSDDLPEHQNFLAHFLKYTELLDVQRGQSFKKVLPELSNMIDTYNVTPAFPGNSKTFTYYQYRDLGFKHQTENNQEKARVMFEKAAELTLDDPDLLFAYAIALRQLNMNEEAMEMFNKLFILEPIHYYAFKEMGYILMEKKMFSEAISYFKKAIQSSSQSSTDKLSEQIEICNRLIQN